MKIYTHVIKFWGWTVKKFILYNYHEANQTKLMSDPHAPHVSNLATAIKMCCIRGYIQESSTHSLVDFQRQQPTSLIQNTESVSESWFCLCFFSSLTLSKAHALVCHWLLAHMNTIVWGKWRVDQHGCIACTTYSLMDILGLCSKSTHAWCIV